MLMRFFTNSRHVFLLSFVVSLFGLMPVAALSQQAQQEDEVRLANSSATQTGSTNGNLSGDKKPATTEEKVNALEQLLERQSQRLDELQRTVNDQQELIRLLAGKISPAPTSPPMLSVRTKTESQASQSPSVEDRLKKVETRVSEIGGVRFSGDIRLRSESIFGQSNNLATAGTPAALGNELTPRHRMRLRARLTMRGTISDEFDWGLRIASGSFADNISSNQTMTDFFNRKPFALDQAFVTYKPKRLPGLRLQGGKFDPPWTATEMTIDSDLTVEGFNQSYSHTSKKSVLRDLTFVAFQLPFLERNSAFVRNADGTVNIDQSRRGGRDLGLFGGQVRARFEPSAKVALNLSVADLYYWGTQFISPVQVFGSQLQLPVTITLPGGATVTSQVSIPRDLLVAGNANLGVSTASNNATNRDGRLASGFNLIDVIARLELKHSKRFPVQLLANFVTNTRSRDVVTAGPGGADLILPNNENNGFWGEVQVGQTRARGDIQFGYTFMRIEKDAVLTPFNMSDITQQSDMRGHRLNFSYAADPRVVFTVTGIFVQRPTGLLGAFATTPPGSLNRPTTRLQLDTVLRF
ncbi:MAG TPA: putative porin [Pyrinomonadaceae bacterium]|nr:putative porin [Pyrinomonadaceae bacterium]